MEEFSTLKPLDASLMEETTTTTTRQSHLPASMIHVPFDVVVEILCRLPVKFLLQFCCVCKSWNPLISNDPNFVKKHLRASAAKGKHLITITWSPRKELAAMSYSLDADPLHSIFTTKVTQLNLPPMNTKYKLVASCDGLLCFAINKSHAVLWNPSTRKLKELPSLQIPSGEHGKTIYAFGYDPFVDNYKVVAVFCYDYHSDVRKTQVQVHTLGTEFWKRINGFPSISSYSNSSSYSGHQSIHGRCRHGIFVGGTVNWLSFHNLNGLYAIVSLHLGKESYEEISHPDHGSFEKLNLGVMRDCLCIFSYSHPFYDVWQMTEYGNKESWVKLIRLPYFGGGYLFTKILYIYEDDNHVLLAFREKDKLKSIVYDCKNDTIKSSKIEDLSLVESKVYVESLI